LVILVIIVIVMINFIEENLIKFHCGGGSMRWHYQSNGEMLTEEGRIG
jgi:hypothetical protein